MPFNQELLHNYLSSFTTYIYCEPVNTKGQFTLHALLHLYTAPLCCVLAAILYFIVISEYTLTIRGASY